MRWPPEPSAQSLDDPVMTIRAGAMDWQFAGDDGHQRARGFELLNRTPSPLPSSVASRNSTPAASSARLHFSIVERFGSLPRDSNPCTVSAAVAECSVGPP